jgi:hypothetical protein
VVADADDAERVQGERLLVLAEADRGHLQQAALDRAAEVGVRLHARDRDDAVRVVRVPVEEDGRAALRRAELDHLHRGPDRRLARVLGDAEAA